MLDILKKYQSIQHNRLPGERPDRHPAAGTYMAEFEAEPDGSFLLIENHCPICAAAKTCQGFCRSELELFRAAFGTEALVMRQEHLLSNGRRCVYRVTSREGTES